jgi:hypothetical protein
MRKELINTRFTTIQETPNQVGEEFAAGLRQSSGYDETQRLIETQGITNEALNKTPPVGLNLRLLAEMPIMAQLRQEINSQSINATILGIAIADGVSDFQKFLQTALNTSWQQLTVMDIDSVILKEVDEMKIPGVVTRETDVRQTGIETGSLDMVLMDHLGNCCPPGIDRQIQEETARILKPGGISIVNITTSELLSQSPERTIVPLKFLSESCSFLDILRTEIYDLKQLGRKSNLVSDSWRGSIFEIEPESFVVFGENEVGHGEWFRSLNDHLQLWQKLGFKLLAILSREGNDSHNPPLRCFRHNIVLRKL